MSVACQDRFLSWYLAGIPKQFHNLCIYIIHASSGLTIADLNVEDLLIRTSAMSVISQLNEDLAERFQIKDLGVADFFLGFQIIRDRPKRLFHLSHSSYATSI